MRWTAVLAAIGLALGVAAMFARVSPFAESGSSNRSLGRYVDWIPIMTGIGAFAGLALGTLAAIIGAIIDAMGSGRRSTDTTP